MALTTVGLIDLRREANLCPTVGAEAWRHLRAASAAMHDGLMSSIAFHKEMAQVKTRLGCRTVATGGKDKDDHDGAVLPAPSGAAASPDRLRVVA